MTPAVPLTSSAKKPTRAVLQHLLQERNVENQALQAQLAALHAATPPAAGTQLDYLRQMQHLFAGVMVADSQGRITWANANFLARWECTLADLVGRRISELPYSRQPDLKTLTALNTSLLRQVPFQFEMPDPSPAHANDWLRIKVQPIRNADQVVEVFVGLFEEITSEKKAHLAMARSEKRFRELAENVPGVLYRWCQLADGSMRSIYCSPQITEIFGLPLDSSLDFGEFIHPDDQELWRTSVATASSTLSPWFFEGRVLVPGQPLRWCRGNSGLSYRDAESIIYSGIIQDITPLRQAEETDRHSTLRSLLAMEGLGIGGWEFNIQTGCTTVSAECRTMIGYPDSGPVEQFTSWTHYAHPADVARMEQAWAAYQHGEVSYFSCEHRLCCLDGTYKWVLNRGLVTKHDALGNPLIFTGIKADITAHKKTREALAVTALRLSATIEKLRRGILLVDENQKVVLTNEAFCQLFSLSESPEQLIGVDYAVLETQMQRSLLCPAGETTGIIPEGPEEVRQVLLTLCDGRVLEHDFAPVRHSDLNIGNLWKFKDITESYHAEMGLRLREEKYRTIIDKMQLGLVEVDLEHRVLYANPNYCQLIGYSSEELIGHPLPDLGREPTVPTQQRTQGLTGTLELPIVTKNGETK